MYPERSLSVPERSLLDVKCVSVVQQWYTSTMNLVGTWLTDRMDLQLHVYQLKILIRIVKVRSPPSFPRRKKTSELQTCK